MAAAGGAVDAELTAARSKAVIKTVNALCAELREDAGLLVDAFGVPDACLADAGDARPQARGVANANHPLRVMRGGPVRATLRAGLPTPTQTQEHR
jgi:hypothetical protein